VGFCQDCGKPLTAETVRTVGTGVFCEPCLAKRVGTTSTSTGYTTTSPYTAVPPVPDAVPVPGVPSPGLATLLGFIPGVGAMYNGQYAKGIAHLVIFASLSSLSDHVNGIFGLLVLGWYCYMVFDAYHTAKARLEGLPLPNAFGLNDIGERFGFTKGWPTTPPTWAAPSTPPPPTGAAAPPITGVPPAATPDWVGYVPPTQFGAAYAPPPPTTPYSTTYAETYTGTAVPPTPYAVNVPPVDVLVGQKRFPVGAFWLIGLGSLILLANLVPDWRVSDRWWPPVLFAGLSVWLFTRRLRTRARLVCIIRWPVILMVLAVLFTLHALYFAITFGLTCSVLLITIGLLLLLERTAGAGPGYLPAVPGEEPQRASFTTAGPVPPAEPVETPSDDTTKGGL